VAEQVALKLEEELGHLGGVVAQGPGRAQGKVVPRQWGGVSVPHI
jgi:hypothetical protein